MADQHIGYPGSVNSAQLASWLPNVAAAQYSVEGLEDGRVVANGIGDRGVTVKKGTIIGDGIMDVFENDQNLNFAAVASGAPDRWDMVVLRRTWNATPGASTSVHTIIQGGPNKSLPARNNNKGVLTDQPLSLCRLKAGQSAVQEIIDLRVWAHNGGVSALDQLALGYMEDKVGTEVSIANQRWVFTPTMVNGTMYANWVDENDSGPWVTLNMPVGWEAFSPCRARSLMNGKFVHVMGEARYTGGPGIVEGWIIASLPPGLRPFQGCFISGTTNSYSQGTIYVVSQAGVSVGPRPVGNIVQFNGIAPLR